MREERQAEAVYPTPADPPALQMPNFRFGQAGFQQRGENAMLARGLLTGAKIALVVGVDSVGDGVEFVGLAVTFEDGEQFIFAMETAHGIVADVGGFSSSCVSTTSTGFRAHAEGECVFEVVSRQAGGIGNHGAHLGAERLMRGEGEKSGVHAAGVGDDEATAASEDLAQASAFSSSVALCSESPLSSKSLFIPG